MGRRQIILTSMALVMGFCGPSAWGDEYVGQIADPAPLLDNAFPSSMAFDGDTAVFGQAMDGDGAAYVFIQDGTNWALQQKLTNAPSDTADDNFGSSVALEGTTLAIAQYAANVDGDVYVFTRSGAVWTEQQVLAPTNFGAGQQRYPSSVGISGTNLIAGAWGAGNGEAFIFSYNGSSWTQSMKLVASDANDNADRFGSAVAINGDFAIIGDPFDDAPDVNSGSAYIFKHEGGTWVEKQKLLNPGTDPASDTFGGAVDIDGDVCFIGAYADNSGYLFKNDGTDTNWVQVLKANKGPGTYSGASGAIAGTNFILGGYRYSGYEGAAWTYTSGDGDRTNWVEQGTITLPVGAPAANDYFGQHVAMASNGEYVISAPLRENGAITNAGFAYIYFNYTAPPAGTVISIH